MGDHRLYFDARRVFLKKDTLVLAFQIHSLSEAVKEKGEIRFSFFKGGEEFRTTTKKLAEFEELPNIVERFSFSDFDPAHYRIQVSLFVDGQEVLFESEDFDITYLEAIARPWIYSKLLPDTEDPIYPYIIGTQLFMSGKMPEARTSLEKAFHRRPDSVDFALNLAQTYMALGEYKKIEAVLSPFMNQLQMPKYEVLFIVGKAYQNLGELNKAIEVFDKAISHYGLNINLLNSIGECYFQLGNAREALTAWEKSLEINPNQPQIKKSVDAIKEKK